MTEDEFFSKLKAKPVAPVDTDGDPIEEFAGMLLRPLDVDDMIAVHEWTRKHGQNKAYQMILARGLRNADGSTVLTTERALEIGECVNGPIARAVGKIRSLTGSDKSEDDAKEDEKKTTLTNGQA